MEGKARLSENEAIVGARFNELAEVLKMIQLYLLSSVLVPLYFVWSAASANSFSETDNAEKRYTVHRNQHTLSSIVAQIGDRDKCLPFT